MSAFPDSVRRNGRGSAPRCPPPFPACLGRREEPAGRPHGAGFSSHRLPLPFLRRLSPAPPRQRPGPLLWSPCRWEAKRCPKGSSRSRSPVPAQTSRTPCGEMKTVKGAELPTPASKHETETNGVLADSVRATRAGLFSFSSSFSFSFRPLSPLPPRLSQRGPTNQEPSRLSNIARLSLAGWVWKKTRRGRGKKKRSPF